MAEIIIIIFVNSAVIILGGFCLFITVFPAIMLMVVIYMVIVFSLNLKGD